MGGEMTAGLSGGQRKLFLFELIYQRTKHQNGLLILLDEPFCGVTDCFLPWIMHRLELMSQKHNVVLVTNDHVATVTSQSDNIITLSAVDRTVVSISNEQIDREKTIAALSVGGVYSYTATETDLRFFLDVELLNNGGVKMLFWHALFSFGLFLLTFWGVDQNSAALVLVANDMIGYFVVKPYLLSLVDWRHYIAEEAEALLHSSKSIYKLWKSSLAMVLIFVIALAQWGLVNVVMDGLESFDFFWAIFFDSGSNSFAFIFFGLYSTLPNETVYTISSLPFLLTIFFSTTFSPGSGLPVVKELRYLFSRFYFWCMTPGVQDQMEGCPANQSVNMFLLALTGCIIVWIFLAIMLYKWMTKTAETAKKEKHKAAMRSDTTFQRLQVSLYGEKELVRLQQIDNSRATVESLSSVDQEESLPDGTVSMDMSVPVLEEEFFIEV